MDPIIQSDPAIERSLELLEKHLPQTESTLWLNPPAQAGRHVIAGSQFFQPHFAQHQKLLASGWVPLNIDKNEGAARVCFALVVVFASKSKDETLAFLQAANGRLRPEGKIFFICPNEYGSKSYQKIFSQQGSSFSYESGRKSRLYFLEPNFHLEDAPFISIEKTASGLWSCPGVFSWSKPDRGSVLLAQTLRDQQLANPVADLGAGIGYLGSTLPESLQLHLFEEDKRALLCAKRNLPDRLITTYWCDLGDLTSWPTKAPPTFASVICNPPFHSGKKENQKLGLHFISLAHHLLNNKGTLWLVGNTHLGYPQKMKALFSKIEIMLEQEGFTVVKAVK